MTHGPALVTGVNGFVGEHVVSALRERGLAVIGVGREPGAHARLAGLLADYRQCDLTDHSQVGRLPLAGAAGLINLAGLAAVGPSHEHPKQYLRVNTLVLDTVGQAALHQGARGLRVVAVSSGAVYRATQPMPLTEDSDVDGGSSPYAASKLAMEEVAATYRRRGLDCVVVRPFNHLGPGQSRGFLLPDLYAKIEAALATGVPVAVGNLSTSRDYTDVRDVARAYADLVLAHALGASTFNVCSGHSTSGRDLLSILLAELGSPEVIVRTDGRLLRPSDASVLRGDNGRLTAAVHWRPTIPLTQSIRDFVRTEQDAAC